jgi:hypothetical protein
MAGPFTIWFHTAHQGATGKGLICKMKFRSRGLGRRFGWNNFMAQPVPPEDSGQPEEARWVYLIRCGGSFKIGVAKSPRARLHTIRTGNPMPVELVMSRRISGAPYAYVAERWIHLMLDRYRVRGEWFRLPEKQARATVSIVCAATRVLHFKHWGTQTRWHWLDLVGEPDREPARPLV